jgi:hypothetical protein
MQNVDYFVVWSLKRLSGAGAFGSVFRSLGKSRKSFRDLRYALSHAEQLKFNYTAGATLHVQRLHSAAKVAKLNTPVAASSIRETGGIRRFRIFKGA